MAWLYRDCPLIGFDGFDQPALRLQHGGEIVVRLRIIRLQGNRALKARDRCVGPVLPVQCDTEIVMCLGKIRFERYRPFEQLNRGRRVAALQVDHREQVERARMVRLSGDDRPAGAFRLVEASGGKIPQRRVQAARYTISGSRCPAADGRCPVVSCRRCGCRRS